MNMDFYWDYLDRRIKTQKDMEVNYGGKEDQDK